MVGHRRELQQVLAEVPLFATCSRRDLQIVARHMEVVELPAGTEVVVEGTRGDAFYVLLRGSAVVRTGGRTVASLGGGDHFGELALLDHGPRTASIVLDADSTLGVLGSRIFRGIVRDVPELTDKLLSALAARLRRAQLSVTDA
jgi:CRP-like cAMP-binding protein